MSYCRKEGKDEIIFVTKEDMDKPSKAIIKDDDGDEEPGLILPNGDINWSCPCLGGMASGPCGVQFREAFSCFHYSQAEPKGADCYESFRKMQDCMQGYPELYPTKEEEVEKSMDMAGEADAATEEAPAEGEEECATS
ncbi:mitochondrial intermembrane space import and assembly protein 40-B-like [Babylonia areolata]|uniref:mitochondrial intermembrane space import and assembly protein 40-B-like n=1 Tax=Babylonia areolata TaxID=304850 RepID=UPI003FD157D2